MTKPKNEQVSIIPFEELKFTSGPWDPAEDTEYGWEVCKDMNDRRCKIADVAEWSHSESEANAKLIAASPLMLKALYTLIIDAMDRSEIWNDQGEIYDDWKQAIEAYKAATE